MYNHQFVIDETKREIRSFTCYNWYCFRFICLCCLRWGYHWNNFLCLRIFQFSGYSYTWYHKATRDMDVAYIVTICTSWNCIFRQRKNGDCSSRYRKGNFSYISTVRIVYFNCTNVFTYFRQPFDGFLKKEKEKSNETVWKLNFVINVFFKIKKKHPHTHTWDGFVFANKVYMLS